MSMQTSWRSEQNHVQDWINLICAVLLFISPWALGFSGEALAARTAWISAVVIGIFSIAALVQFAEWEEWLTLLLGLWLIVAPWVVGFSTVAYAFPVFVALGVIIALASISELWVVHHPEGFAS